MVFVKKTFIVQLVIDAVIIMLGLFIFIFSNIVDLSPNTIFSLTFGIYAGLELCEFIFDHTRKEPLYIFIAAGISSFSGCFLSSYDPSYVISLTLAVWIIFFAIIKIISLEEIMAKKSHLFTIKLVSMSMLILLGIFVCVIIYLRINSIGYVLALMYLSYGVIEGLCDFLSYLSEDSKFLKE